MIMWMCMSVRALGITSYLSGADKSCNMRKIFTPNQFMPSLVHTTKGAAQIANMAILDGER